ncbi:MAG TPA: Phenylacetic acid catabolic protein [Candidatus Binataceae bacterium]|nr:Phenylacetic acid catabolic protein [Candidatus Binataceae bacterium]
MPVRREFAPRSLGAADVNAGRVEPHYARTLARLLAAHAMAEKLTAFGYERALETVRDNALRPAIEKNCIQERGHARLLYRVLEEIGVSQQLADRSMIAVVRAPSFEAPMYFAQHADGELDLLMASLALDTGGRLMIGINYKDSSYAPHARAADLILEEEAGHDLFASEQLAIAAERFGRKRVNAALRAWIPRAVNFFGPPGSGFSYDCLRYGLKVRDNQEIADLYLTMVERRCDQLGLKMPRLTREYPRAAAS